MKKIIPILVTLFAVFVACEKQEEIYKCSVGHIKYEASLGYDFDSALDSLLKVIIYRPNEPYIIVSEPLDVEYPVNDREFYWIAFKDTANRIYLGSPMDVLDTKGDWYKIIWGED